MYTVYNTMIPLGDDGGLHFISIAYALTAVTATLSGALEGTVVEKRKTIIAPSVIPIALYTIFQCGLSVTDWIGESFSSVCSNTAVVDTVWAKRVHIQKLLKSRDNLHSVWWAGDRELSESAIHIIQLGVLPGKAH